jgi:hypothetical protein
MIPDSVAVIDPDIPCEFRELFPRLDQKDVGWPLVTVGQEGGIPL